jgi:hypothetical protein
MLLEWISLFGISDWITLVIDFIIVYRMSCFLCKGEEECSYWREVIRCCIVGIILFIIPSIAVFISMSLEAVRPSLPCLWMGNFFVFVIFFILTFGGFSAGM